MKTIISIEKMSWIFSVCYLIFSIMFAAIDDKAKGIEQVRNEINIDLVAVKSGLNMLGNSIKFVKEREYKYTSPIAFKDYKKATSPFDYRELLNAYSGGTSSGIHQGLDIVGVWHCLISPIAMNGEVIDVWMPPNDYYSGHQTHGGYVRIRHPDNWIEAHSHLSTIYVREGDLLIDGVFYRKGKVLPSKGYIGRQGNTGQSWGEHLHLSIQNNKGKFVNALHHIKEQ